MSFLIVISKEKNPQQKRHMIQLKAECYRTLMLTFHKIPYYFSCWYKVGEVNKAPTIGHIILEYIKSLIA